MEEKPVTGAPGADEEQEEVLHPLAEMRRAQALADPTAPSTDGCTAEQKAALEKLSRRKKRFGGKHDSLDEVFPNIFVSSAKRARDVEALRDAQIEVVIVVVPVEPTEPPPDGIRYHYIPMLDTPEQRLEEVLPECFAALDEAMARGQRTLVHCLWGVSRSVAVVTAFLIVRHRMRLFDALQLIKSKRACADPNMGFCSQLSKLERTTHEAGS